MSKADLDMVIGAFFVIFGLSSVVLNRYTGWLFKRSGSHASTTAIRAMSVIAGCVLVIFGAVFIIHGSRS